MSAVCQRCVGVCMARGSIGVDWKGIHVVVTPLE